MNRYPNIHFDFDKGAKKTTQKVGGATGLPIPQTVAAPQNVVQNVLVPKQEVLAKKIAKPKKVVQQTQGIIAQQAVAQPQKVVQQTQEIITQQAVARPQNIIQQSPRTEVVAQKA